MSNLYKNSVKNLEKRNSGVKLLWFDFWFLNIRRMNKAMESNDEQWWTFDSIHTNLLKSGVRKECRKVECQVNSISIIFLINTALNCIKKLIFTFAYQKGGKKMESIHCINNKINIHAETFSNMERRIRTANPA